MNKKVNVQEVKKDSNAGNNNNNNSSNNSNSNNNSNNNNSGNTTTVTVKKPAKVTKVTATVAKNKKKVTLKWKKVKNANGYVVYRATKKNGKYTKVKTITKASTVKFTDKKVKKGKTYYYKVRAYKKASGTKVYGTYSAARKVKIRK